MFMWIHLCPVPPPTLFLRLLRLSQLCYLSNINYMEVIEILEELENNDNANFTGWGDKYNTDDPIMKGYFCLYTVFNLSKKDFNRGRNQSS